MLHSGTKSSLPRRERNRTRLLTTPPSTLPRSYIRTIYEITTSPELARWASHAKIQARIPGFRVRMGFGLHFGWAVEAAIGSSLKIDPSYLSPHVSPTRLTPGLHFRGRPGRVVGEGVHVDSIGPTGELGISPRSGNQAIWCRNPHFR